MPKCLSMNLFCFRIKAFTNHRTAAHGTSQKYLAQPLKSDCEPSDRPARAPGNPCVAPAHAHHQLSTLASALREPATHNPRQWVKLTEGPWLLKIVLYYQVQQ